MLFVLTMRLVFYCLSGIEFSALETLELERMGLEKESSKRKENNTAYDTIFAGTERHTTA